MRDVDGLLNKVSSGAAIPSWVKVVVQVTVPVGHPATFGARLDGGLYVVVGGDSRGALRRVAAVSVGT
jgi:hypothetical protein